MSKELDEFLVHSWGTSQEDKRREKEYNARYYQEHKDKWLRSREKNVTDGGTGVYRRGMYGINWTQADETVDNARRWYNSKWKKYDELQELTNKIVDKNTQIKELLQDKDLQNLDDDTLTELAKLGRQGKFLVSKYHEVRKTLPSDQHALDELSRQYYMSKRIDGTSFTEAILNRQKELSREASAEKWKKESNTWEGRRKRIARDRFYAGKPTTPVFETNAKGISLRTLASNIAKETLSNAKKKTDELIGIAVTTLGQAQKDTRREIDNAREWVSHIFK